MLYTPYPKKLLSIFPGDANDMDCIYTRGGQDFTEGGQDSSHNYAKSKIYRLNPLNATISGFKLLEQNAPFQLVRLTFEVSFHMFYAAIT